MGTHKIKQFSMLRASLSALLFCASLSGCAEIGVGYALQAGTTLYQAATISDKDVMELGNASAEKLDKENKLAPQDSPYQQRLDRITEKLRSYEGHDLQFKVYINKDINAFALPNGDIRVYSGLLDKMNDDEVLFVIGHEIGHVMLGHAKSELRTSLMMSAARQALMASGNSLVSSLSSGQIGDLAHKLIESQYSQEQEYEADEYGLKIVKENNVPKSSAVSALRKIAKLTKGNASIFSSHPDSAARANRIEQL